MRRPTTGLSRRKAIAGAIAAALGIGAEKAFAQQGSVAAHGGGTLAGKVALVTGSTDGLGREVAKRLAALGATVIVHGRNRDRDAEVVASIAAAGSGSAVFYQADLASFAGVRGLAETVLKNHERFDILINNAGIWTDGTDARRTSVDGYELTFAVNYLAGYLLTHSLLPLLDRSFPARIVNVASLAQQPIDFDDVMLARSFSSARAYAQSKLAQILFTMDLADELPADRVTVNSLHPATLMNTTMVEKAGATPRSTVDEGADAVMQLAVSPALARRSGLYFNGLKEARANAQAYDATALARLRALSRELTGVG